MPSDTPSVKPQPSNLLRNDTLPRELLDLSAFSGEGVGWEWKGYKMCDVSCFLNFFRSLLGGKSKKSEKVVIGADNSEESKDTVKGFSGNNNQTGDVYAVKGDLEINNGEVKGD